MSFDYSRASACGECVRSGCLWKRRCPWLWSDTHPFDTWTVSILLYQLQFGVFPVLYVPI